MESCARDVERLSQHVPILRAETTRLKVELIRLQQWTHAHPDAPHPAAPGGPMCWDELLRRFGHLERELRMLNEKIADSTSAQLRHFVVVPRLPDEYDHNKAMQAVAGGRQIDPGHLPPILSTKLHPDMLEEDRKMKLPSHEEGVLASLASKEEKDNEAAAEAGGRKRMRDDEQSPLSSSSSSSPSSSSPPSSSIKDISAHNKVVDALLAVMEQEMGRGLPFGGSS